MAKLTIKYNINLSDGMAALRWYFISRVIRNLCMMPRDQYCYENFKIIIFLSFHQDYMAVLGSSALISRLVKMLGYKLIAIHRGDPADPDRVEKYALGCLPVMYVTLGWVNVFFECDLHHRVDNFMFTMLFIAIMFCMYMYSSAWQESGHCVKVGRDINKHSEYMKIFILHSIAPLTLALFYHDSRTAGDILPDDSDRYCCYDYIETKQVFQEEDEDPGQDFVTIVYFAYQLSFFSIISFITMCCIMLYSWTYLDEEDEDEGFEYRVFTCFGIIMSIEAFTVIIIFDMLSRKCTVLSRRRYMLCAMAFCNVYSTIVDRGFGIGYKAFHKSREMKAIMDNMRTLDEDELEDEEDAECVICEDDIDEMGKQAECGHLFHSYCIKEWIVEYGPICPECNKEFKAKGRGHQPVEILPADSDDEDDDPDSPNLDPNLVIKIYAEMQKFDQRSSFYTENGDVPEKKNDDDDEEEEDDD